MVSKQSSFPGFNSKTMASAHGGELAKNKRKTARPFDRKQALHVVLRSSHARGRHSMLHPNNCNHIRELMSRLKDRWGIKIYRYANVGNHLHLLLQAPSRTIWQRFIREFSGGVAMIVTGARKGHGLRRAKESTRGFWDHLVFTRIVSFGRDFKGVGNYILGNLWEAAGVPVRKILARGFKALELSEDGAVFVPL